MLGKVLIAAGVVAAGLATATAAEAQPGPPCDFALSFICNVLPIAPGLEHDVDLTQQPPPAGPNAPLPETPPPADPCAGGCI